MPRAKGKDLAEIFGHAPDDLTRSTRQLWQLGACPFVNLPCVKHNHDNTITYGTCSVRNTPGDEVIICPYRLYANNYGSIRSVSADAFGPDIKLYFYSDYIKHRRTLKDCVVALGTNSGKEVHAGRTLSMDWILARVRNGTLVEYTGVEVQSIDITGNYRDNWHAYNNLRKKDAIIPASGHGLNWANVHKRLIPQLIRKGIIYSRSELVKKGLYFIVPDAVYAKFEGILGDIPTVDMPAQDTISVLTYSLGQPTTQGRMRSLVQKRVIRFSIKDFAERFISGANLPSGADLDSQVRARLSVS